MAALPAHSFILDGEVAVYDHAHISRSAYMVFDVLKLDGKDWGAEPLWKRRRVLEELVAQERLILPVRVSVR